MSWTVKVSKQARTDLDYLRAHDSKAYLNCYNLSVAVSKDPFSGPGNPTHIEGLNDRVWCRRTSISDHMVYEVFSDSVTVASYRSHLE